MKSNVEMRLWINSALQKKTMTQQQAEELVVEGAAEAIDWVWRIDDPSSQQVTSLPEFQQRVRYLIQHLSNHV